MERRLAHATALWVAHMVYVCVDGLTRVFTLVFVYTVSLSPPYISLNNVEVCVGLHRILPFVDICHELCFYDD